MTAFDDGRFDSLKRLYGEQAFTVIKDMHVCIIGLGGVG